MVEVVKGFVGGIESYNGIEYEVGLGCEILYFFMGNFRDYYYGVNGVNYFWIVEFSLGIVWEGGFVLLFERIWQVVEEQWFGQ